MDHYSRRNAESNSNDKGDGQGDRQGDIGETNRETR